MSMEQKLPEIKSLEGMIDLHIITLSRTANLLDRQLYEDNLRAYQEHYKELTGEYYMPNPKIFAKEEEFYSPQILRVTEFKQLSILSEDIFIPSQPMDSLFMQRRPYDVYDEVRYNEGVNL